MTFSTLQLEKDVIYLTIFFIIKLGLERDDRIFSELAEKLMAPCCLTLFSEATLPILTLGILKMERALRQIGRAHV